MSKKMLIDRMRRDYDLSAADAEAAVERVVAAIKAQLGADTEVRIPGFGTFSRRFRDTRPVRNPRTGEMSTQLAHHVIRFKESKPAKK